MPFRLLGVLVLFHSFFLSFFSQKIPSYILTSSKATFRLMRCLQNSLGFWEDCRRDHLAKFLYQGKSSGFWYWTKFYQKHKSKRQAYNISSGPPLNVYDFQVPPYANTRKQPIFSTWGCFWTSPCFRTLFFVLSFSYHSFSVPSKLPWIID